jgi:hypothetical protein
MSATTLLADRFEEHRPHMKAVAYRRLGSLSEAEDAVQQAWLRLDRSDPTRSRTWAGGSRLWSPASASTCCARAASGPRTSSTRTCPIRS